MKIFFYKGYGDACLHQFISPVDLSIFHMENRSDGKQSQNDSHEKSDKRRYDQVNGIRNVFTQPLFKFCCDNACSKGRKHRSLITCHRDKAKELHQKTSG